MKTKYLIILLLFCAESVHAQLRLSGKWRYSFTDDKNSIESKYDDAGWETKGSDKLAWTKQELAHPGSIIWIRKQIIIPSSLKSELRKTGALMLFMGRIKQEDKAYLNGKLIGETNSGDLKRAYVINEKDILWDQENTIAVRISHWGDMAAVEGDPVIAAAKPDQIFKMTSSATGVTNKEQVKGKNGVFICAVENKADRVVKGALLATFYDINQKKLEAVETKIVLKKGRNAYPFSFRSPSDFLKVTYTLTIPADNHTSFWNDEFGYISFHYQTGTPVVAYKARQEFEPAQLDQQTIGGWLGKRLDANKNERLYKVDETTILAGFINKPGIHPWIGEHVGKFLEAACNTYKNTGDAALRIQIDRTAQQLIAAQLNNGYLGTYVPESEWTSWDVWSHKYDLIGLLSYYNLSGYRPALVAAEKIGHLLATRFGDNPGQLDIIKAGEHVGMAATSVLDPMTDLYLYSGKKEFLDFCYCITASYNHKNGPKIIETLDAIGRVDKTANAKAYEMLSNLVGLAKLYRVTDDQQFLTPVLAAWKDIATKRLYITGTASSFEHFHDDYVLPGGTEDHIGEGCVTTTWLQLNYQLLCLFGKMEYVNELERSVYNHLTGAENPQTGCVSYYTPLMGVKPYGCNITCCMSSVPRGIAMIPLFANGKINGDPSFLFYQPGVYKTLLADKTPVTFVTDTKFPENGDISITINPEKKGKFEVLLRKPYWADAMKVEVNGQEQVSNTKEMLALDRIWTAGDRINIRFSMDIHVLNGGISYPGMVAFQRGPQVLVLDKSLNPNFNEKPLVNPAENQLVPVQGKLPRGWIGDQAYQIKANINDQTGQIILVPYADASQTGGSVVTWFKAR